jgi:hypothetical protein
VLQVVHPGSEVIDVIMVVDVVDDGIVIVVERVVVVELVGLGIPKNARTSSSRTGILCGTPWPL